MLPPRCGFLRSSSFLFDAGIYFLNRLIDMGDRASFMAVEIARRLVHKNLFRFVELMTRRVHLREIPRALPGELPKRLRE